MKKTLLLAVLLVQLGTAFSQEWDASGDNLYYNDGNVGIGTSSPSYPLTVYSDDANADLQISTNLTSGTAALRLRNNSAGLDGGILYNSDGRLSFYQGTSEILIISQAGNVGINEASPEAKLTVMSWDELGTAAGDHVLISRKAISGNTNYFMENTWFLRGSDGNAWTTTRVHNGLSIDVSFLEPGVNTRTWWERDPNAGVQAWGNGSDTYMTIDQGNVGIGDSDPDYKLSVAGEVEDNPVLMLRNNSYSGSDTEGTVSMQFAFQNHIGPIIQAYKHTFNTTGIKFYTEYGFNTPQFAMIIQPSGTDDPKVGIGTDKPDERLTVYGTVHASEVKIDLNVVPPDYVFDDKYQLPSLTSIAKYVKQHRHLPEVPSADEMSTDGVLVGEMNMLLLKKVEELTLYIIEQDQKAATQTQQINALEQKLERLQQQIEKNNQQ